MKKTNWLFFAVMNIFILAGCGTAAHVQKDNSFDFSKVKTYAWVPAGKDSTHKTNDLTDTKIRQSVDKQLRANGWRENNTNPDVLLVYDVDIAKEGRSVRNPVYSQPTTRWFYNPYSRRYVSVYYPSEFIGYDNSHETVTEGTFTLTVKKASTEKTIWQGWTSSEINGKHLTDREIDDNVKVIIRKLV